MKTEHHQQQRMAHLNNQQQQYSEGMMGQSKISDAEKKMIIKLQENDILINEMRKNLQAGSMQSNLQLIEKFRNNVIFVLMCMSNMKGIMSKMPPIPIQLNTILLSENQGMQQHQQHQQHQTMEQARQAQNFLAQQQYLQQQQQLMAWRQQQQQQ
eukprot:CAMPEP_0117423768 /NCGR_PEP_ID=MMETSP0758-20121206/4315_1 /TAXON_ID=63605 /ORGANISM="Percolomonas cosmopolitus, Strain AE-1 (ATCC 50343)" /LENGTH=154 /DNA_ID=CAMNT_0005207133 /DNA_START=880 /DNA_END=1347 /DNA_ORIENTATION=-